MVNVTKMQHLSEHVSSGGKTDQPERDFVEFDLGGGTVEEYAIGENQIPNEDQNVQISVKPVQDNSKVTSSVYVIQDDNPADTKNTNDKSSESTIENIKTGPVDSILPKSNTKVKEIELEHPDIRKNGEGYIVENENKSNDNKVAACQHLSFKDSNDSRKEQGNDEKDDDDSDDDGWQEMTTVANNYDVYDDRGELINGSRDTRMTETKRDIELKHEKEANKKKKHRWNPLASHSSKSKEILRHDAMHNSTGYTRIAIQSQAESYAQTDKKTDFLFQNNSSHCSLSSKKKGGSNIDTNSNEHEIKELSGDSDDDTEQEEEQDIFEDTTADSGTKSAVDQLQTTKSMLKDEEIFAYVGLVKLILIDMATDMAKLNITSDLKNSKRISAAQSSMAVWANSVMISLYDHMGLIQEEREMIEKLSRHGLEPEDLVKSLVKLETVKNPVYENEKIQNEATIVKIMDDNDVDNSSIKYKNGFNEQNIDSSINIENISNEESLPNIISDLQDNKPDVKEGVISEAANQSLFEEGSHNATLNPNENYDDEFDITDINRSQSRPIKRDPGMHDNRSDEFDVGDTKPYIPADGRAKSSDTIPSNNEDDLLAQKTIKIDVAWTVVCDLFLILIYDSVYDSRSRTLLMKFGNSLKLSNFEICRFEKRITDALEIDENTEETLNENEFIKYRSKKNKRKRLIYIGLAGVGGSLILGISGGLLGPLIGAGIAAGLSTVGIAGTSGFLAGTAGTAIVTTVSTGIGAKVGLQGMMKRTGSVKTFEFKPLHSNRRVNLIITVSGWMNSISDDIRLPFSTVDPVMGDLYSLLWEPEMLTTMGQTINILANEVLTQSVQQILGATILTAFMASIQVPMALSKLSYILDNPWNVSLDRAWSAGLILADTLISRNLGVRPITLVGFSIGSRLIYSCLIELAKKGAYDLVENVIIFGSPFVCNKEQLSLCRSVVSGRFVNGYSKKDWILGYLFRATSGGIRRVVGLSEVHGVEGIENFDCTPYVTGHMEYRTAIPKLLKLLGISVLSEDFIEIDEPDPEETERQRKLVLEFDKNAEQILRDKRQGSHKKSKWKSWFKPKRKEWWEVYAEGQVANEAATDKDFPENGTETADANAEYEVEEEKKSKSQTSRNSALFNVEELKKEIAKMKANGDLDELNSEMEKISTNENK